jgi:hypothetical protein
VLGTWGEGKAGGGRIFFLYFQQLLLLHRTVRTYAKRQCVWLNSSLNIVGAVLLDSMPIAGLWVWVSWGDDEIRKPSSYEHTHIFARLRSTTIPSHYQNHSPRNPTVPVYVARNLRTLIIYIHMYSTYEYIYLPPTFHFRESLSSQDLFSDSASVSAHLQWTTILSESFSKLIWVLSFNNKITNI